VTDNDRDTWRDYAEWLEHVIIGGIYIALAIAAVLVAWVASL